VEIIEKHTADQIWLLNKAMIDVWAEMTENLIQILIVENLIQLLITTGKLKKDRTEVTLTKTRLLPETVIE
jgi:hypothetical protein